MNDEVIARAGHRMEGAASSIERSVSWFDEALQRDRVQRIEQLAQLDAIADKFVAAMRPRQEPSFQRMYRRHEVETLTGLACSTLYELMAAGLFPKPIGIGSDGRGGRVAWLEADLIAWQQERIAERDAKSGP